MKYSEDIQDLITEHKRLVKRLRECDPDDINEELDIQEKELTQLERFLKKNKGK